MAAKTPEAKLLEHLRISPVLNGLLAKGGDGKIIIHPGRFNPIGEKFPQICFNFVWGPSEEVLPAKRGTLQMIAFAARGTPEPYKTLRAIVTEVDNCLNKRPQRLTEVNAAANEGLRFTRLVSNGRTIAYEENAELYSCPFGYDVVMDDEFANYQSTYGEEVTWP